jgi:antirestriction protein
MRITPDSLKESGFFERLFMITENTLTMLCPPFSRDPKYPFRLTNSIVSEYHGVDRWLLRCIASWQDKFLTQRGQSLGDFQVWTLTLYPNNTGRLTCDRDHGEKLIDEKISCIYAGLYGAARRSERYYLIGMNSYPEGGILMEESGIGEDIAQMLGALPVSDAGESETQDVYESYRDDWSQLTLQELLDPEKMSAPAKFLEEHGWLGEQVLTYYRGDIEKAREAMEKRYRGCYEGLANYAYKMYEECYGIPDYLKYFIDYQEIGYELTLWGHIFTVKDSLERLHVFSLT